MNYNEKNIRKKINLIVDPKTQQKNRIIMFLVSLAVGLFIGGAVIAASFCVGAFTEIIRNAPSVEDLDTIRPNATKSIVYASDGTVMQELIQSGSNRESVSYDQIPDDLVKAFVSIEDARFFTHDGVDVKGIFRAIAHALFSGSFSEGASTLTQQLIKNNVFEGGMEDNFGDRIERKFQEQYMALKVERELDKDSIVADYLNTINLGSNCLGVQVASKRYFGKDVSELDLAECTVLAAITQNPGRFNPITHPENNQDRRVTVLKYMLASEYISQEDYDAAVGEEVYQRIQTVTGGDDRTNRQVFSYFTDEVFRSVAEALQERYGYTDTQAYNMLYSGGLRIYSTMDPRIQAIVDEEIQNPENYVSIEPGTEGQSYAEYALTYRLTIELRNGDQYHYNENSIRNYFTDTLKERDFELNFESKEALQDAVDTFRDYILTKTGSKVVSETVNAALEPQASVVFMDQATGQVLAIAGGREDKSTLGSLVLDRAVDSPRQPGSTFKILSTYAPAIDIKGQTLASTVYDAPTYINGRPVSNYWGSQYLGYCSLREGIAASMNVVAVRFLQDIVSVDLGFNYAQDFGISTLAEADRSPLFSLGGLTYGATNLEMTAAYAAIANDGVYTEPVFWTKVTDASGRVILENVPETKAVIKPSTAHLLTLAMHESVSLQSYIRPDFGISATSGQCNIENAYVAGKSGTTTDANDIWFIGYTPGYTMGIWSGYDSGKSFGDSPGYHKVIWHNIMTRVHEDTEYEEVVFDDLVSAVICSKSGLLAREGVCEYCGDSGCRIYTEYFEKGTEPTEYCDRHKVCRICRESGLLATQYCPESSVTYRVCLTIDPEDDDGSDTADKRYVLPESLVGTSCYVHWGPPAPPTEPETEPETEAEPEHEEPETETEP